MSNTAHSEVESTIARLTTHKNVKGVLVLSRENGIIIKSAGNLFDATDSTVVEIAGNGDRANRYAKIASEMVEFIEKSVGTIEIGDQVRLLRIRTKQHELLITPDATYIMVVVQDPTL